MFSWFSKQNNKEKSLNLSRIALDIHSHMIPGIDDGVETMQESIEMATKMLDLGYVEVYTTPHVMWDCYKNSPEIILAGLQEVRAAYELAGINLKINAAAEYFIDEHFIELLQTDRTLLTLPGKRLLVELPYSTPLLNLHETLFFIIQKGYQPVLAHPERYSYFYTDPSVFQQLSDQGCELQVNILSLYGHYGSNAQKLAEHLLQRGLISYLGTDAHKLQHLMHINKIDKNKYLQKYEFQNEKLLKVEHSN